MITIDIRTEIKARGLERQAALLEQQADDREGEAPRLSGYSQRMYFESIDRVERFRREARALRARAAALRRDSA